MAGPRRRREENEQALTDEHAYQVWLGGRIRTLRTAAGLNQDDFSYHVGIQRSYVGLIEKGARDLRINTLRRIATAFGLEVHELLNPDFALTSDLLRSREA